MDDTVTCTNPDCTENGIPKDATGVPPEYAISCGACWTELRPAAPPP
jgi:hypothetical protein